MKQTINLGDDVFDTVSGLQGIATARIAYLHGSQQLLIDPGVDEKGAPQESKWVEEGRCDHVKHASIDDNGRVCVELRAIAVRYPEQSEEAGGAPESSA